MLKKIKNKIKKNRKVKYQKIVFSKKDIILRKKAIKYLSEKIEKKIMNINPANLAIFFLNT